MIDGDDRDAEGRAGHDADVADEGDVSASEHSPENSADAATADAARPQDDGHASEEQPAMQLDDDGDEGGTIEADDDAEYAGADTPGDADEAENAGSFDGAALQNLEYEEHAEDEDLSLLNDDDALPWLESSDYDDIESVDAWRITGFVVMGLVVLALLVGGIWYFYNRNGDGEPVADGSTIAAPDGPYKERPEDPGGKTFKGTGDMAPAVGEGESREGRLAQAPETPEPVAPEPEKPAATPEPAPTQSADQDGRIAVQVGAYRDKATAEAGWRQLSRQTDALSGVEYRIVKGEADIGTVYRLQALPGDMAAARRLAKALKDDGVASQIKR